MQICGPICGPICRSADLVTIKMKKSIAIDCEVFGKWNSTLYNHSTAVNTRYLGSTAPSYNFVNNKRCYHEYLIDKAD